MTEITDKLVFYAEQVIISGGLHLLLFTVLLFGQEVTLQITSSIYKMIQLHFYRTTFYNQDLC